MLESMGRSEGSQSEQWTIWVLENVKNNMGLVRVKIFTTFYKTIRDALFTSEGMGIPYVQHTPMSRDRQNCIPS